MQRIGVYCAMGATLGLAQALSMITLGPLDGREERGIEQGRYPYKYKCDGEHKYFKGVDKR